MKTVDKLQEVLKTDYLITPTEILKLAALPVICKSGATLSIQASWFHYCEPRADVGPYTHVEVGFPKNVPGERMPTSWRKYAEDSDSDISDIYICIPIELVAQFIDDQGGLI